MEVVFFRFVETVLEMCHFNFMIIVENVDDGVVELCWTGRVGKMCDSFKCLIIHLIFLDYSDYSIVCIGQSASQIASVCTLLLKEWHQIRTILSAIPCVLYLDPSKHTSDKSACLFIITSTELFSPPFCMCIQYLRVLHLDSVFFLQ